MNSDILFILQWWFTLFIIGIGFLPITTLIFSPFWDKGYAFSRIIGIIVISYTMLLLGTLHILPFHIISLIGISLFFSVLSLLVLTRRSKQSIKMYFLSFKKYLPMFLIEEIIFLLVLILFSFIRGFSPDINGLEKFMDFGFVNSILRTEYFPAKDMWFTPFSINYYYFGHLQTAVLTKVSLLPSSLTYNLMLAYLAASCFLASFSIAATLYSFIQKTKRFYHYLLAGLLAGIIVTFAENIHTLYSFFEPYQNEKPVPLWELTFSPDTFPNSYWYPNATRFIHNTIHEFPMYSWTVSDLHGHVLDIPHVLLVIGLLLSLFLLPKRKRQLKPSRHSRNIFRTKIHQLIVSIDESLVVGIMHLVCISFLLAILYMTNAWDGMIYFLLTLFVLFILYWKNTSQKLNLSLFQKIFTIILDLTIPAAIIVVGFVIFSLPFSLFFKPFVSGIGILCAPAFLTSLEKIGPLLFEADHCQKSPWWQLVVLYGFFYFFILLFIGFLLKTKKIIQSDIYILVLIILATLLIIIPEFIYVKDIYPAHYRANTMFKLVFQAFIILGVVTAYIIYRVLTYLKLTNMRGKIPLLLSFFITTLFFLSLVLIYPYFSLNSYYGEFQLYKGINGTKYLETKYPADYKAMQWLDNNITNSPVIVEAQGDSYTDYARVSANTGLPTILGWTVHEWLWRGSYDIPAPRIEEIKTIYESSNTDEVRTLLETYNVEYIFIGVLEREKYPTLNETTLQSLGKVVFKEDTTMIIKVK